MLKRLKEITARLEAATPVSEWKDYDLPFRAACIPGAQHCQGCYIIEWDNEKDQDFIAHAPADIAFLVRVAERYMSTTRRALMCIKHIEAFADCMDHHKAQGLCKDALADIQRIIGSNQYPRQSTEA